MNINTLKPVFGSNVISITNYSKVVKFSNNVVANTLFNIYSDERVIVINL